MKPSERYFEETLSAMDDAGFAVEPGLLALGLCMFLDRLAGDGSFNPVSRILLRIVVQDLQRFRPGN